MAGEVKYGNTLVSSRKDGVLTYAKYVKDLKSGQSVQEVLGDFRDSLEDMERLSSGLDNAFKAIGEISAITESEIDTIWSENINA